MQQSRPPRFPRPLIALRKLLRKLRAQPAAPAGFLICGFGFPLPFGLAFSLRIPPFPPFPIPPTFNFLLQLRCDLSDPFSADFGFGGGRVVNADPEADSEFGA